MSENGEMISSKELMDREGISRATLNNYIKLGLLPSPVVQKPVEGMTGTKRIGYFPRAVVERLARVKTLKKEGLSIDMIVTRLREERERVPKPAGTGPAFPFPRHGAKLHGISRETPADRGYGRAWGRPAICRPWMKASRWFPGAFLGMPETVY